MYWQYSYLPPSDSTFSATGSKQPVNSNKKTENNNQSPPLETPKSLEQKAKLMGLKIKNENKQINQRENEQVISAKAKPEIKSRTSSAQLSHKTNENSDNDDSIGNATIHGALPELKNKKKITSPSNERLIMSSSPQVPASNHYNDTIFGDEQNELDSLRSNYQNNLTNNLRSDDENEQDMSKSKFDNDEDEIEEEVADEEDQNDETYGESQKIKENYMSYTNNNSTGKSEDGVVVGDRGSWDPNETSKLPKQGNEDFVIIEISNFSFKENCNALKRSEVKKLFVGMNFLNYDPADLESKDAMPKPKANEPVFFNFRKSKL